MTLRRYLQMRLLYPSSSSRCLISYATLCLILTVVFYHIPISSIVSNTSENQKHEAALHDLIFTPIYPQSSKHKTSQKKSKLPDKQKRTSKSNSDRTKYTDVSHTTIPYNKVEDKIFPFQNKIKSQMFNTEHDINGTKISFPKVLTEKSNHSLKVSNNYDTKITHTSKSSFIKTNITESILHHMQIKGQTAQSFSSFLQEKASTSVADNKKNSTTVNESTMQNYPTKPRVKIKMSSKPLSKKNTTCNVEIELSPCNCTRILHPVLESCPMKEMTVKEIINQINNEYGESTCSDWATLRGNNQKVVSFSLFGTFPNTYYESASEVIEQFSSLYPGWLIRFYHDINMNQQLQRKWMCSLACKYKTVDFCEVSNLPGGIKDITWTIGTIWRISVMGDPLVSRYMVRDLDSPILQREVDAVNSWLKSDKCFHIMRDNPNHNTPMMGGMWGGCTSFHPEAMSRLRDTVFRWSKKVSSPLSRDQLNVNLILWPTLKKSHIAHDSFSCQQYPESQPFPSRRKNLTFVGMRAYRESYANDQIHEPCPIQCRPIKHKDWEYC